MREIHLFFDHTEKGGCTILGCIAFEGKSQMKHLFKNTKMLTKIEEYNNFNWILESLNFAIEELYTWLKGENFPEILVTLVNQNAVIFKWLQSKNYALKYDDNLNKVYNSIEKVILCTEFEFSVINGKDNKAKVVLKNAEAQVKPTQNKLDFSDIKKRLIAEEKKVSNGEQKVKKINDYRL